MVRSLFASVITLAFLSLIPTRIAAESDAFSLSDYRIAFTSYCNPERVNRIYTMRLDGTELQRLTNTTLPAAEGSPMWSPDRTRISFGSDLPRFITLDGRVRDEPLTEMEGSALYIADVISHIPVRVLSDPWGMRDGDWVNNDVIAFNAWDQGSNLTLHRLDLTSTFIKPERVIPEGFRSFEEDSYSPLGTTVWAFSPDGNHLAFSWDNGETLYVADADATNVDVIIDNQVIDPSSFGRENAPISDISWSSDSEDILFRVGQLQWSYLPLFRVRRDGTGLVALTDLSLSYWSPDGQWFADQLQPVPDRHYIRLRRAGEDLIDDGLWFEVTRGVYLAGWLPDRSILILSRIVDESQRCSRYGGYELLLLDVACFEAGCTEDDYIPIPNAQVASQNGFDIIPVGNEDSG